MHNGRTEQLHNNRSTNKNKTMRAHRIYRILIYFNGNMVASDGKLVCILKHFLHLICEWTAAVSIIQRFGSK